MKKFLSILLTLAMVVSLLPASAFAANNTATTMRLARTQGTVAVTNVTGKKVTQTANMKLYNGYRLKTGARSYAWISLDDTKVAKLDANSIVSVQKSGQKLTLYLSSGNIFFNVKEKLSGGESFHIKTSTMTTGIRGTSGCVRVINPRVTEIHLLTGQIEVYTENPEMNVSKTAVLKAGQKAYSLIAEDAMERTGEQADIIIEQLTNHEVCGNCSIEIAADPELIERIEEEAPHLLPEKIADEAEERLEADEEAAEEKQKEIDQAVAEQELPEDVDPYFEKEEPGGGGGGGGGSTADSDTVYAWDELVAKINEFNGGTEDMTITLGENLPNAEDLNRGTALDLLPEVDNANGNTLTLNLSNYILGLEDTWVNNGNLVITNNDGMIGEYNDPDPFFNVIENNGNLTLQRGTIAVYDEGSAVVNNNGATFIMKGGAMKPGELSIDGSSELVFTEVDTTYTQGVGNFAGGYVEISGGTIEVTDAVLDYNTAENDGTYDVKITGGTFTPLATSWGDRSMIYAEGDVYIGGATFDMGNAPESSIVQLDGGSLTVHSGVWNVAAYEQATGVYGNGDVTIEGGTINVDQGQGIYLNDGSVTMTGGTINVSNLGMGIATDNDVDIILSDGAINLKGDEMAQGVVTNGGTVVMNGTDINATTGLGLSLAGNTKLTLDEGTTIKATGDASAVEIEDTVAVTRPIKATVSAEKFDPDATDDRDKNGLFYPMLDFLHEDADGTGTLWDRYGEVYDGKSLAYWMNEFNAGDESMRLTFVDDIVQDGNTFSALNSSGKNLTIDMDTYSLTLDTSALSVDESTSLTILGEAGAVIQGDASYSGSLIENNGGVLSMEGMELIVPAGGTGIQTTGEPNEQDFIKGVYIDATAAGATGIELTGTATAVLRLYMSTMEVGNGTDTTARGIVVRGGAAEVEGPSQTAHKITVNSGVGLEIMGANGEEGTLLCESSGMDVSGSATGIAIGDGGSVTFSGMKMDLTNVDGATAVSVAKGGTFTGETEAITFKSPSKNSIGIHAEAGAEVNLESTNVLSSSTSNANIRMVYLEGTAAEAAVLNLSDDAYLLADDNSYCVYSEYSTINMTGGKIGVRGTPAYGIYAENSEVNITGGEITPNAMSTVLDNYGIYLVDSELTFDGGTIDTSTTYTEGRTYLFHPLYADNSTLALTSGEIISKGSLVPVSITDDADLTLGDDMVVKRYNNTEVLEVRGTDTGAFGYNGPEDGFYILANADDVMNRADWFITQVETFNAGTADMTITLPEAIDLTTATKTMPAIGTSSDTKTLTIDLNSYALTLAQTMENAGNLVLTGDGTISADNAAVTTLIQNSGTVELADAKMQLSEDQTGIANANAIVEMSGGLIQLNDVPSSGIVSDGGEVNLTGGEIVIVGCGSSWTNYGINAVNTAVTIDGGAIRESDGLVDATANINYAVYADGGSLDLKSGTISVHYGQAVGVSDVSVLTLENATVTGKVADNLLVTADNDETGFTSSDYDGTYFVLENETSDDGIDTWVELMTAIEAFNGSSNSQTIALAGDIDPTAQDLIDVPIPATGLGIGNGTASVLTIDLGTYTLGLPTTLATASSSSLEIRGSTGSITAGTQWDDSTYLLDNRTTMTLAGGTIEVPHGVVGVNNTGIFNMTGGEMEITYSTGIQNEKEVFLSGGQITLVEDNANYSNGGADPIGYMAYAGSGSMAELEISGTDIIIEQGILYYNNDGSESIYSAPVGVYNETDSTVTFTDGTLTVGSGVGISNNGNLKLDGSAVIAVEEAADAVEDAATGIESFGGFFEFTDGTVKVTRGGGVKMGAETALDGGMISVEGEGTAVSFYTTDVTMADSMVVRAVAQDMLYFVGTGGALPDGYEASDTATGGYYYLEKASVPVSSADEFVMAVNSFDGSEATNIKLAESITVNDTLLQDLGYDELATLSGSGSETLTIDLQGNTLTLDTPLNNNDSMLVTDTSGAAGTVNGSASSLVINNADLTWDYGNMTVSAANGVGLTNNGTAVVGNGSLNSDTNISLTGSGATAISVAAGDVTVDGMQITTAASGDQTGIVVSAGAELTVDSATIYATSGNTGIENNGTAVLNGASLSSNSGNAGTLVKNTGDLTVADGTMTTDMGAAVDQSAGTFTMTGGTITTTAYAYAAVNLTGGSASLEGGTIKVNSNGGGEKGVTVAAAAALTVDGVTIQVNGSGSSISYKNYGIYDNGGTVEILSGTITADSGVTSGDTGNAYALYSTQAAWADLVVDAANATVQATAKEAVISPAHDQYAATETATDGYYSLESTTEGLSLFSAEDDAEESVTEELVAEEPVAEEPVTEEPVAEEPAEEEPVTEEPVAEEPVTEEPVTEEPAA